MIVIKTSLKKIPDKCNKCKYSISERNYKNSCGVARYCTVSNNKEIPHNYSLELDCHGFIRPKWCPLTEIKNEVI